MAVVFRSADGAPFARIMMDFSCGVEEKPSKEERARFIKVLAMSYSRAYWFKWKLSRL